MHQCYHRKIINLYLFMTYRSDDVDYLSGGARAKIVKALEGIGNARPDGRRRDTHLGGLERGHDGDSVGCEPVVNQVRLNTRPRVNGGHGQPWISLSPDEVAAVERYVELKRSLKALDAALSDDARRVAQWLYGAE